MKPSTVSLAYLVVVSRCCTKNTDELRTHHLCQGSPERYKMTLFHRTTGFWLVYINTITLNSSMFVHGNCA